MKNRYVLAAVFAANLSYAAVAAPTLDADAIMEKNFQAPKVETLRSVSTMTLIDDRGQTRTRKMENLAKLLPNGSDTKLLVRFLVPADIKGTAFLQVQRAPDDDLWVYLPAIKKTRRLVAGDKKDSFFGSDFSYGDILPPSPVQYRHTRLREERVDGHDCYVIESVPREAAVVRDTGYAKKISWVRKDNFLESKIDYFDADGRPLKTQRAGEHKEVEPARGRWLALRREMHNHQTGHRTVVTFDRIEVGQPIADTLFAVRALERE